MSEKGSEQEETEEERRDGRDGLLSLAQRAQWGRGWVKLWITIRGGLIKRETMDCER